MSNRKQKLEGEALRWTEREIESLAEPDDQSREQASQIASKSALLSSCYLAKKKEEY